MSASRAMRDSTLDWLGLIPEAWELKPFFTVCSELNNKNKGMKESNLLSLSYGNIVLKDIDSNEGLLPESFEGYQIVEPDDLVFRFTDLQNDQRSLRSAISQHNGIITSAYLAVRPVDAIPRYLAYLMRAYDQLKVFYSMGGGLRQAMNFQDLKRLPLPIPPLDEQQVIVDFLDRETAQIDALIEKQKQLIATLGERRQSVISNAVTKGIDEDVPVKYSGLPWLGNIPENWSLKPLKSIATLNPEVLSDNTDEELPIRYIEISNVSLINGVEGWTETKFGEAPSRARRVVRPRDVLISTVRTYLRAIGMVREVSELGFDVASTGFAALRAKSVNSDFLELAITAEYFVSGIEAASVGVSYPGINSSQIMSMRIPVPPLDVQGQISAHVRSLIAELDILKDKTEKMIEVLKERRQALISAVVTGKIDVRGN